MKSLLVLALALVTSTAPTYASLAESTYVPSDFQLRDINTKSERSTKMISPRQYKGQISVWYFGKEW